MINTQKDLRIIKTYAKLNRAFYEVISEQSFEDFTVFDLCERAGVRRATFYKHFTDKFQYLASFTRSLRENFDSLIWKQDKPGATAAYYTEYVNRVLMFIKQHKRVIENIMNSGVLPTMISVIMEQNYEATLDRLRDSVDDGMTTVSSADTIAAMFSGGITAAIYIWIIGGMKKPSEDLAKEINAIISVTIGTK